MHSNGHSHTAPKKLMSKWNDDKALILFPNQDWGFDWWLIFWSLADLVEFLILWNAVMIWSIWSVLWVKYSRIQNFERDTLITFVSFMDKVIYRGVVSRQKNGGPREI